MGTDPIRINASAAGGVKFETSVAPNRFAYAFYATSDTYAVAVLVFVHLLRQLGIREDADVVVLHLPVSRHLVNAMRKMGIQTRLVTPLRNARGAYHHCFVKLRIFELSEYERVVYADADAMPLKTLDALFTLPGDEPIAAPPAYWLPQPFRSSHLLVVKPSADLWNRVSARFAPAARDQHYDMDIVNREFGGEIRTLPADLTCIDSEWEDARRAGYFADAADAYRRVSVVHFTALGKPWSYPLDQVRRLRPHAHAPFYDLRHAWWQTREQIFRTGSPLARLHYRALKVIGQRARLKPSRWLSQSARV
jgi:alpha-N-acetylglucosamine transferase